jgi:hypothetical protein
LVELLVVVAIIGILIGLLLPAVQMAREAGRRTQCANHVRQLAVACLHHEEQQQFLPSGGWGYLWVGDTSRGFGKNQPGSWLFSILPFIEESNIRELSVAYPEGSLQKRQAIAAQNRVVVSFFYCPTRRAPIARRNTFTPRNSIAIGMIVRSDYAANFGDVGRGSVDPDSSGPPVSALQPSYDWTSIDNFARTLTGVIFVRSEVRGSQITDGTSNTFLLGEKHLDPQYYEAGRPNSIEPRNDNQGAYTGGNWDNLRVARQGMEPIRDTFNAGESHYPRFGSAHASGWNVAICDGSVTFLTYEIDGITAGRFANRGDGQFVQWPH